MLSEQATVLPMLESNDLSTSVSSPYAHQAIGKCAATQLRRL